MRADYVHADIGFAYTVGYIADQPVEVFIDCAKQNTPIAATAIDGAILISLLLQHYVPLATIAHSIQRNPDGSAVAAVGHALDLIIADHEPNSPGGRFA